MQAVCKGISTDGMLGGGVCVLVTACALLACLWPCPTPRLIVDSDMGGGACRDLDDVVALCAANALADRKEVELVGVVINSLPTTAGKVASAINAYYGRETVPVGRYQPPETGPQLEDGRTLPFVDAVVAAYPPTAREMPNATDVYLDVLSSSPPKSVVIVSIGMLTNLQALLEHPSGARLVSERVQRIVVMGGHYPPWPDLFPEPNFAGNPPGRPSPDAPAAAAATAAFTRLLPEDVPVHYFGFSRGLFGGRAPFCVANTSAPDRCRRCSARGVPSPCALALSVPEGSSGFNWDPWALLAAARGARAASLRTSWRTGQNTIAANGDNSWRWSSLWRSSQQRLLSLLAPDSGLRAMTDLDDLLCQEPLERRSGSA